MTLILLALALLAAPSGAPESSSPPAQALRGAPSPDAGAGRISGAVTAGRSDGAPQAGRANYANPSHGPDYLAIRADRGTLVRICGAGACWVTRSTDYGPDKDTGDIADIALVQFARICGWTIEHARRMGECDVTVERLGDIKPPETSTR